ncbi:Spy/CpxP family protein refolding chaperone [Desulfovibrio sp. Fe33]|uniref:Spy/CpxP family protein refolding chaperone n=1 Tax=Desulfovibrio sp. Fe33 TaxID=3020842 RepID=UPI00234D059E|nr:Spy/CpxP family protein refolding chaperone [Desulfovibrio sp. Fe33]
MSKKNITISALAAALVLSMAAFALAGPGQGRGFSGSCGGPGYGPGAMYNQLTPEKQAEADAIVDKYEPQFEAVRNALWAKRSVLQAMVNGGNADEAAITKLVNEISAQRGKMWELRKAMGDELVKATGIAAFGDCPRRGPGEGRGPCSGNDCGPGRGMGPGQGMGSGQGMNRGMF